MLTFCVWSVNDLNIFIYDNFWFICLQSEIFFVSSLKISPNVEPNWEVLRLRLPRRHLVLSFYLWMSNVFWTSSNKYLLAFMSLFLKRCSLLNWNKFLTSVVFSSWFKITILSSQDIIFAPNSKKSPAKGAAL